MKILVAIVHYWNPNGGGAHQSLRPSPEPRIEALTNQILSLRRLGYNQSVLHMIDRAVYRVNDFYRNDIDIIIVNDGTNHVLDRLHPSLNYTYKSISVTPKSPRHLGFEAHKILSEHIDSDYDLYCYLEDDLLVYDPAFFLKINHFTKVLGDRSVVLPQRYEVSSLPHAVDRFYIDGPLDLNELKRLISNPGPVRLLDWSGFPVPFSQPENPHSGCFFLNKCQLQSWMSSSHWLDFDISFISPLESAATLGISKSFDIYKPCFSHAGWLDIQHFGTSFHSLIADMIPKNA